MNDKTTPTTRAREVLTITLASFIGTEKAEAIAAAAFAGPSIGNRETMMEYLGRQVPNSVLARIASEELPDSIEPDYARGILDAALDFAVGGGVSDLVVRIACGYEPTYRDANAAGVLAYVAGLLDFTPTTAIVHAAEQSADEFFAMVLGIARAESCA